MHEVFSEPRLVNSYLPVTVPIFRQISGDRFMHRNWIICDYECGQVCPSINVKHENSCNIISNNSRNNSYTCTCIMGKRDKNTNWLLSLCLLIPMLIIPQIFEDSDNMQCVCIVMMKERGLLTWSV